MDSVKAHYGELCISGGSSDVAQEFVRIVDSEPDRADCLLIPMEGMGAPTDEQVLAGCQALSPSLFQHGLRPREGAGPATRDRMAEDEKGVRAIYAAMMSALLNPKDNEDG